MTAPKPRPPIIEASAFLEAQNAYKAAASVVEGSALKNILRDLGAEKQTKVVELLKSIAAKPKNFKGALPSVRLNSPSAPRSKPTYVWQPASSGVLYPQPNGPVGGPRELIDPIAAAWEKPTPKGKLAVEPEPIKVTPELVDSIVTQLGRHEVETSARSFGGVSPNRFMYALLSCLLTSKKPRNAAGLEQRVNIRTGLFAEFAMPFRPEVVASEKVAAIENLNEALDTLANRGKLPRSKLDDMKSSGKGAIENAYTILLRENTLGNASAYVALEGASALLDSAPVAPNMWMMRLTGLTDAGGKKVLDHFRGHVFFDAPANTIEITPIGLGEAKLTGGTYKIIGQVVKSVARIRDTLSASELPIPKDVKIKVRWGKRLTVILQTEDKLSVPSGLPKSIQKASGSKTMAVEIVQIDGTQIATDGRHIVRAVIKALLDVNVAKK